ncbi:MAG: STAS domain-containing protein [Thermoanaerobaculales bacterium]|nr:STAS domain-containing protein [Thermoanaerobaculales bacterium]
MSDPQIDLSARVFSEGFGLITASGYINNEGGQAVADAATDLVGRGCKSLLVDLEGTRIINSIGVSILLEIMEKLMEGGGELAFCSLTPTIAKTFEIMGLDQYAQVFSDRETALSRLIGTVDG